MSAFVALETSGHLLLETSGGLLLEVQPVVVATGGDDWSPQFIQAQAFFYARQEELLAAKRRKAGEDAEPAPADWLDDDLLAALLMAIDV